MPGRDIFGSSLGASLCVSIKTCGVSMKTWGVFGRHLRCLFIRPQTNDPISESDRNFSETRLYMVHFGLKPLLKLQKIKEQRFTLKLNQKPIRFENFLIRKVFICNFHKKNLCITANISKYSSFMAYVANLFRMSCGPCD